MQLRNRYYTYPVIDIGNDFYVNSSFETDADYVLDGYTIRLSLRANLDNPELQKMLKDGDIQYVHHIECPQTCYRKSISTNQEEMVLTIKDDEINGMVQVCGFLIAKKSLIKYENSLFAEDYRGFKFDIDKGCILAVGNQVNIVIDKMKDDLSNSSSIFLISRNLDPNVTEMNIDMMQNKIVVNLPDETYGIYDSMSTYYDVQPVMHSMLIIPALQYVLYELKEDREQLYNYSDYRWFKGLEKSFERIDMNLDQECLENIEPLTIAQKLIGTPVNKAMMHLVRGDGYED